MLYETKLQQLNLNSPLLGMRNCSSEPDTEEPALIAAILQPFLIKDVKRGEAVCRVFYVFIYKASLTFGIKSGSSLVSKYSSTSSIPFE
jgi:hypothetical protein